MPRSAPHRMLISCEVSVHQVLKTGETNGDRISGDELRKVGLDEKFILWVDGLDRDDCLKKSVDKIRSFMDRENG